ncbi:MAG: hypothetical protein N0E59_23205, partial [Candidatus Thiodiazotropha taylori]|nr:hypothetical protein [Candidatus Thiodiazotropha taylori]MCW4286030.1 hypothetical protein [Candidatus Thiodiazotropha taylori]
AREREKERERERLEREIREREIERDVLTDYMYLHLNEIALIKRFGDLGLFFLISQEQIFRTSQ